MRQEPRLASTNSIEKKHRESIEKLERLDLSDRDKTLILLSYAGMKPVSEISWATSGQDPEVLRAILSDLELDYVWEAEPDGEGTIFIDCTFGRDKEKVQRVVELFASIKNDPTKLELHNEVGRLLGYPETAIEAFADKLRLEKLPAEIEHTPLGRFKERAIAMRLSQDHWRDELVVVENWMNKTRELSPKLYEHIQTTERSTPPHANAPRRDGGGR